MITLLRLFGSRTSDIRTLLRSIAFNWLILGTDAHAKNYGLLLSGTEVRLSPLYDVASLAPYENTKRRIQLAQKIGGENRARAVAARHWARLAETAGIDPDQYLADIRELARLLPGALATAARRPELDAVRTPEFNQSLDRIRVTITDLVNDCRDSLELGPTYERERRTPHTLS